MLISYTAMLIKPEFYNHLLHGVLIGGFALMTLSVAVRVVMAHGGWSLEEEISSKTILWVAAALSLATGIRVFAIHQAGLSYFGHLAVASTLFTLGIVIWFSEFGKKMKRSGQEGKR
jgi:uncharacterized protein involved in response to NO